MKINNYIKRGAVIYALILATLLYASSSMGSLFVAETSVDTHGVSLSESTLSLL